MRPFVQERFSHTPQLAVVHTCDITKNTKLCGVSLVFPRRHHTIATITIGSIANGQKL